MKRITHLGQGGSLDEMLFENRNKAYGAYILRQESDLILTRALMVGIGLFALASLAPFLIAKSLNLSSTPEQTRNEPVWVLMEPLAPIEVPEQSLAPPAPRPVEQSETQPAERVPVPVRKVEIKAEPTPKTGAVVISEKATSSVDLSGKGTTEITGPVTSAPLQQTGGGEQAKPEDPNALHTSVDVAADFKSGIEAFRSQVVQRFDGSVMTQSTEVLKTTVSFIVEKDGTLSAIRATGPDVDFNKQAERTIASIRGKWRPAKVDGKSVRSYFRFPISMRFE